MNERTQKTLQEVNKEIARYLDTPQKSRKFKGMILVELHCNDGGIGNVKVYAEHSIRKRDQNKKNIKKFDMLV